MKKILITLSLINTVFMMEKEEKKITFGSIQMDLSESNFKRVLDANEFNIKLNINITTEEEFNKEIPQNILNKLKNESFSLFELIKDKILFPEKNITEQIGINLYSKENTFRGMKLIKNLKRKEKAYDYDNSYKISEDLIKEVILSNGQSLYEHPEENQAGTHSTVSPNTLCLTLNKNNKFDWLFKGNKKD